MDNGTGIEKDWVMSPAQYVNALYHLLLGRAPDQGGFEATVRDLQEPGDPTRTLMGMLGTAECRRRLSLVFGNRDWIDEVNRSDVSSDNRFMEIVHQLRSTHPAGPALSLR